MPPYCDGASWSRKHDDPEQPPMVENPLKHCYPDSLQDIIELVQMAEDKQTFPASPEVRVSGSHWALSEAAVTHDFIVETQDPAGDINNPNRPRLNRTLYDVIPECMTAEALRFFIAQPLDPFDPSKMPDHTKFYLYHVEAGTRIYELYCRLDVGDDSEPRSLAAQTDPTKYAGPWAMATLGGAAGQTIVGAFSTGTHGGDVHLPPLPDAVQAVHLVGTEGKQYWIERELVPGLWLVDEDKLRNRYGDIEVIRDAGVLNAVIVAAGRMGIIYSVVLRVVRQYALEEERFKDKWTTTKMWLANPGAPNFMNKRFVQVVVNPNAQPGSSEHSCFVTYRYLRRLDDAGSPPFGRAERCEGGNAGNSVPLLSRSSEFLNAICEDDSPAQKAITLLIQEHSDTRDKALLTAAGLEVAILSPITPPPAIPLLQKALDAALAVAAAEEVIIIALDALRNVVPSGPIGKTLAAIGQWCLNNDYMEIFRRIADAVIEGQHSLDDHNPFTAISYAVLDIHNYKDIGCSVSGDSLEVFFDVSTTATSANMIAFVEKMFQRVTELENGWPPFDGLKTVFPGYASLRFMSKSGGLIAMQQFNRACAIEVASVLAAPGTIPYLKQIEQDAVDMGATVHWGQRNDLDVKQVEAAYNWLGPGGALFQWRKVLSRLSRNGRFPTFSTEFTRQRGLEIVQPLVGSFSVQLTEGCAGEPVRVNWTAGDNPPGTEASLVIRRLPAAPSEFVSLPALDGSQDVPLPVGRADFELTVSYTYAGRTLTDSRSIEVRGYQEGESWNFIKQATCYLVDGQPRWCADVTFGSTVTPTLKITEVYCDFGGGGMWFLRRAGQPDLSFSPAMLQQPILDRPVLRNSSWFFYAGTPGCAGVVPDYTIRFKLSCGG